MRDEGMAPVVNGVRSKKRVKDLAEVFTPPFIVDNMLELVMESMRESDSSGQIVHATFLEPSCGNGNFLWAILEIKARAIEEENEETPHGVDLGIRLLQALSSISAIDISPGNVEECHVRILRHAIGWYRYLTGFEPSQTWATVAYGIIEHKIVVGDFLEAEAMLHDIHVTDEGLITIKPVPLITILKTKPIERLSAKKKEKIRCLKISMTAPSPK